MPPDIANKIAALASRRWPMRHRAERSLLSTRGFILPQLAAAISKATSLEQRDRLLRIFIQLYLRQFNWLHHGNPFMGIAFIAQPLELRDQDHGKSKWIAGVAVARTLPGFPGGLLLRTNDLIIKLNGHAIARFDTASAFHAAIQQFHPGNWLTLELVRNGKLKKVKLQLAGISSNPVAQMELLHQRNLIARHLIHKYMPPTELILPAPARLAQ